MFVQSEDPRGRESIRRFIGIVDRASHADDLERFHVNGYHLMLACRGCKDATDLRHCNHAMYSSEAITICNHLLFLCGIEDQLIRFHVGDVQTATLRFQTVVDESNCGTRHRYFGYELLNAADLAVLRTLRKGEISAKKEDNPTAMANSLRISRWRAELRVSARLHCLVIILRLADRVEVPHFDPRSRHGHSWCAIYG